MRLKHALPLVTALVLSTSCVKRELHITSEPSGALVFLNDQEIGRTPVTRPFTFYGTYDVVVRKEGYETLKAKKLVLAPWWQWVPIDLVAELFPLTDKQKLAFELKPVETTAEGAPRPVDPDAMFRNAEEMRGRLAGPETRPTTRGR